MSQKSWHKLGKFSQAIIKVSSSYSLIQRPGWRRNYFQAYSNCLQNCPLCGWRTYISFLLIFGQGPVSALRGQLQFFVKCSSSNMASCIFKVHMREIGTLARLVLDAYHLNLYLSPLVRSEFQVPLSFQVRRVSQKHRYQKTGIMKSNWKSITYCAKQKQADS